MKTITIDELITQLAELKKLDGFSGETLVFSAPVRGIYAHHISGLNHGIRVSEKEAKKGDSLCKMVSNRGIKAVLIF